MSIERRISRLEQEGYQTEAEASLDSLSRIREAAVQSIEHSLREGSEPVFQVEDGLVYTRDGRSVTTNHQTLAEVFYQWELEWLAADSSDLVFDEDAEEFRTHDGGLALSRNYVSFPLLMGEGATPID